MENYHGFILAETVKFCIQRTYARCNSVFLQHTERTTTVRQFTVNGDGNRRKMNSRDIRK